MNLPCEHISHKAHPQSSGAPHVPAPITNGTKSVIRQEIARIADRFASADQRLHAAQVMGQPEEADLAEEERREALGEFWSFSQDLADLQLLLLRHANQKRRDALEAALLLPLHDAIESLIRRTVHEQLVYGQRKRTEQRRHQTGAAAVQHNEVPSTRVVDSWTLAAGQDHAAGG
jgi:hypothetical protein